MKVLEKAGESTDTEHRQGTCYAMSVPECGVRRPHYLCPGPILIVRDFSQNR